jgi:hypothetical protein
MRKQIESIQRRATLISGETRTHRVSCNITVYQEWVDTSGYGGKQYTPGTFAVVGTIAPENLPAPCSCRQGNKRARFRQGQEAQHQLSRSDAREVQEQAIQRERRHDVFQYTPLPQIGGRARMKIDFLCPLFVLCQSCSWEIHRRKQSRDRRKP